jgi:mono/diheme cytochrome c family protein/uncharacterized membrane protein
MEQMLTRPSVVPLGLAAALWLLMDPGPWRLTALAAAHAQHGASRSLQSASSQQSASLATETPAARKLFQQHCVRCHGADGTGKGARDRVVGIPNFTDASWHAQRKDAQLLASILDGKGKDMPPWREKISEAQARSLTARVRAFAPSATKAGPMEAKKSTSASFEERYRRLQEELDELKRQYRAASESSAQGEQPKPPESSSRPLLPKPAESSIRSASSNPSEPAAISPQTDRELFRKHCVKCHGADGTGTEMRRRRPELPDFTDPAWQARRRETQLLASILDGKGTKMPPWRADISEEQARGLVAYIRSFASGSDRTSHVEQPADESNSPAEAEPPGGFVTKLLSWLGQFHPPSVHFPIALLAAAAVAELLRLLTGNPTFDAISRYCLWFGAVTALLAGALGWFLGGFRLTDGSWIMMLHRWLGTSTVAGAGLVLIWGEGSRRPERHRSRAWFRVALLLEAVLGLITGFFGGAVVFGLDHYAWPP